MARLGAVKAQAPWNRNAHRLRQNYYVGPAELVQIIQIADNERESFAQDTEFTP